MFTEGPVTMGKLACNHRSLFLTVLESWKSETRGPADGVSGEGALLLAHSSACCVLTGWSGARELFGVSSLRVLSL